MKAYGTKPRDVYDPFMKKGCYERYGSSRTKSYYKRACKRVKSRERFKIKREIDNENDEYLDFK